MLTQDLGRLNNAHGSIGGSRLRPDRRGREGDAFVACLFQGWVPCIAPVGSGRVGGSVFSLSWHLFVSVCACLLLIGRGVPQYRVATFLNQLKNSSTSSHNDREEKLPPPVEVSMYLALDIIEKWYSESFKVIRRWCVFIILPLN